MHGGVGVSAENTLRQVATGVRESTGGNFRRQAEPARVQAIQETRQGLVLRIPLLQLQVEQGPEQVVEAHIVDHEAVELMTVYGDVAQAPVLPVILLVNTDADQVRHDLGKAMIVVAFDPNHFHVALGIGELADGTEKLPVLFLQTSEIQVGKDVAQQDQPTVGIFAQDTRWLRAPGSSRSRGAGPTRISVS